MEPFQIQEALEGTAGSLDSLSKELDEAHSEFDAVEQEWDALRDLTSEGLKDQMVAEERKGDPAEHTITSAARRQQPELYARFRQAKRRLARLELQSSNRRSELTAYQSLLKTEIATGNVEIRNDRRGLPQHAQRRVA